jgi:transcriptional regulator with GAF, ATPase, and Fis domain
MSRQPPIPPPERAKSNAHLRRYEELEMLYAEAPVGLCVLDSKLRYLRVNERHARLHGQSVDAYPGCSVVDVMPAYSAPIADYCQRVLATGTAVTDVVDEFDASADRAAPQARSRSYFPLKSEHGEVECVCVVTRESTEVADADQSDEDEDSLAFEKLMAKISHWLVIAEPHELDARITASLAAMGRFLRVDIAALMQRKQSDEPWSHTHEWTTPDWPGPPPSFKDVNVEAEYPWLFRQLAALQPVAIDDTALFPDEAVNEKRTCDELGIRSVLWVPFKVAETVEGFLCFDAVSHQRSWSEHTIRRLSLTGEAIGNALARAHALAELERMNLELKTDNESLKEMAVATSGFEGIVWRSDALSGVLYQIEQVAKTDSTVLLLGETGTGKELMARAVHSRSARADRPLVTVNCAALPASLIESELFGHEKGAFTGAVTKRIGRFELAHRGTIFLDEIGDLPIELQAKLLRVLQQGEFEPLGSERKVKVDVRVIAATNTDLKTAVEDGTFRADLFYRLNVFPVTVPPLRERRTDIPLLVWYFIDKHKQRLSKVIREVPQTTMDWLCSYDFPGNVRELENIIERALILSSGSRLEIGVDFRSSDAAAGNATAGDTLAEVERAHISKVLEACDWRIKGKGNAAERLALHPNTLRFRMNKLGIKRPG